MNLTLRQVFLLAIAGLALLLGVLFYVLMDGSRRSILQTSDRLRDEAARRISGDFRAYLESAEKALSDVEGSLRFANLRSDDAAALEAALFAQVRNNPRLAEVALTHADTLTYAPDGALATAEGDRWQVSAYRVAAAGAASAERIVTRRVFRDGAGFAAIARDHPPDAALLDVPPVRVAGDIADPTDHPTFRTLVSREFFGESVWSDLHWAQADAQAGPAGRPRRAEVTVQKAIEDRDHRFIGVLRVGLLAEQMNAVTESQAAAEEGATDPHRVFVCDPRGRLVTRITPDDRLEESGDDLRFVSPDAPPEVAAALRLPVLAAMKPGTMTPAAVTVGGRKFLVTFRALDGTQEWVVVVLAPEDFYLRGLTGTRNRLLLLSLGVMALILAGGAVTLRAVQRGLSRVAGSAARMQDFDFSPSKPAAPFRDVRAMLDSLERAKTAMRALGKYVPVSLVRRLYQMNREPALGGESAEVTLMFTDIAGFTTIAERLSPGDLALLLGEYFAALTAAVHANGGIVDKFIGDAVMAVWNVPTPVESHARRACAAALDCLKASGRLSQSVVSRGLPPLATRVGVHCDTVLVGHFGSPDRMSYTVLGDGVNLAARLEGLNKQYGTHILVSEAVRDAVREPVSPMDDTKPAEEFRFRLIDRVVVKGKSRGVAIYELRGAVPIPNPGAGDMSRYEEALAAYVRRDFDFAANLLASQSDADPPSRVLADRCRLLAADPPPVEWDGVFVARTK